MLYLGGKGPGLKLLYDRMSPGIDPLGGDNILAFMTGVFPGTGAPCSARFAALCKSPLTGLMVAFDCARKVVDRPVPIQKGFLDTGKQFLSPVRYRISSSFRPSRKSTIARAHMTRPRKRMV